MMTKRFAIIGGSIWGNRGAAAMLETTIGRLRELFTDIQFAVFTPYPLKDKMLVNDTQIEFFDSRPIALIQYFLQALGGWLYTRFGRKPKFSGAVHALTRSDILLDIGGITFADGRFIFLPYNILSIWPSIMFGVPVVKLSQAAGSFRNPIIRILSKLFLSRCTHFFARGERTFDFLRELGLDPEKLTLAADIAFCYKSEYCLSSENSAAVSQLCSHIEDAAGKGQKIVAISPSILVLEQMKKRRIDYIQLFVDLAKKINQKNVTFVVFPNASREGSRKTRNNDLHVIELLRDEAEIQLPSPFYKQFIWVTFDVNTCGIEEIIKRSNVLITSRFHAMVFGLRLGIPTVVIGWGHKYREVMRKFGQDIYVFGLETPDIELCKILDKSEVIANEIRSALVDEKASSNKQFEFLARSNFEVR